MSEHQPRHAASETPTESPYAHLDHVATIAHRIGGLVLHEGDDRRVAQVVPKLTDALREQGGLEVKTMQGDTSTGRRHFYVEESSESDHVIIDPFWRNWVPYRRLRDAPPMLVTLRSLLPRILGYFEVEPGNQLIWGIDPNKPAPEKPMTRWSHLDPLRDPMPPPTTMRPLPPPHPRTDDASMRDMVQQVRTALQITETFRDRDVRRAIHLQEGAITDLRGWLTTVSAIADTAPLGMDRMELVKMRDARRNIAELIRFFESRQEALQRAASNLSNAATEANNYLADVAPGIDT